MPAVRRRFAAVLAVHLLPWAAAGQMTHTVVFEPKTLEEVESLALANSPSLAAARAELAARRAAAGAAGVLDDPRLELDARNFLPAGEHDPAEAMIVLEQPLPGHGQRRAERDLAAAEIGLAEVEAGGAEQRLLRDVRLAWAEIYALSRELEAMSEAHELLDLLVASASTLYGAGQAGLGAPLMAQLELSRHDLDVEAADAKLTAAAARLAALAGGGPSGAIPRVTALPEVVLPKVDPAAAAPFSLDAMIAHRRVLLAESRLAALEAGLSPGFTVGGGLLVMDGADPNLVARVGVELPFFRARREKPRIEAARLEVEALLARRHETELGARAELARWLAEGRRLETVRRRYREAVLPQGSAALDAARAELLAGRGPLSEVLERFEDWYHDRIDLARAEADRYVAWAEIEALLASPLPAPSEGGSR